MNNKTEEFLKELRLLIYKHTISVEGNIRLFPEANAPEVKVYIQWNANPENKMRMTIEQDLE
jgi:hypothetical protein